MIKKLVIYLSLAFLPVLTFAAYDTVSLTTSAIISINNSLGNAVSLTVSGSADVVESITVGASSFTVVLQSGSALTVTSAGRNLISTDAPDANETVTCGDTSSSVALSATAEVTVTVNVSANACGAEVATASSSSNSNGGPVAQSGGGGGSTYITPAPVVPTSPSSNSEMQTRIAELLALVQSLQSQLGTTGASTVGSGVSVFAKNMVVGSKGADVKSLQRILNSDSDTKVASTGAGSPGKETTLFGPATKKAIQKFQIKYKISGPGKTGYGVFGPKTRAKVSEVAELKGL